MSIRQLFLGLLCAAFAGIFSSFSEVRIDDSLIPRNVFGGTAKEYPLRMVSDDAFQGRMAWQLAAGSKTIARGEQSVRFSAGADSIVKLELPFPAVNPGTIFRTVLMVSIEGAAEQETTIWVFAQNAFADRRQWLEQLPVHLYDPDGATAKAFDEAGIPYADLLNPDVIDKLDKGILIVGEGISFLDNPALWKQLRTVINYGVPVVCLVPADGELPLPASSDPRLTSLALHDASVIPSIEKHLSASGWYSNYFGLQLNGGASQAVVEVAKGKGWPWLEISSKSSTSLTICGFPLLEQWVDSPTPTYLLMNILERVAKKKD